MCPICLLPINLKQFANTPYKKYGANISTIESKKVENINLDSKNTSMQYSNTKFIQDNKNILCFIGGFLDSYYRCLFDIFTISLSSKIYITLNSSNFKIQKMNIMYITFDCFNFLSNFIPNALNDGYRFYIISHSWGAKNIIRILLKYNFNIELLISLDCVGHFNILERPSNIKMWENIYIANFYSYYNRANLAALIGGGKQYISFADSNIALNPPAHHASVSEMLSLSNCIMFV